MCRTQNIFIGRGGIIKLGDLGISRVLEGTYEMANTVTGTPYYMAPEGTLLLGVRNI